MSPKALLLVFLLWPFTSWSQETPYYVVIGAYKIEANAQRAMSAAHSLNLPAVYAFQPDRKLHYVFVRVSSKKEEAFTTMRDIRAEGFKDAWVYHGHLNYAEPHEYAVKPDLPAVKIEPVVNIEPETVNPETPIETVTAPVGEKPVETTKPVPAGKPFVFKLVNSGTGNEIVGQVRLQENERATQSRPFRANELVYVTPPANKNSRYHMVCTVIGFKPFRANFSYKDAGNLTGTSIGPNQEIVMSVPLERVKRGDYVELEEVKFYTNSNVMTPESERELKELVAMMNENPKYQIRLHGHTNGDQGRDIVSVREGGDLFHTSTTNEKFAGTSKQLSTLRAESVKLYLVQNGIDESRISVRGEGGKQMIFDPKSTLAGMNDRVEVEITRD